MSLHKFTFSAMPRKSTFPDVDRCGQIESCLIFEVREGEKIPDGIVNYWIIRKF